MRLLTANDNVPFLSETDGSPFYTDGDFYYTGLGRGGAASNGRALVAFDQAGFVQLRDVLGMSPVVFVQGDGSLAAGPLVDGCIPEHTSGHQDSGGGGGGGGGGAGGERVRGGELPPVSPSPPSPARAQGRSAKSTARSSPSHEASAVFPLTPPVSRRTRSGGRNQHQSRGGGRAGGNRGGRGRGGGVARGADGLGTRSRTA